MTQIMTDLVLEEIKATLALPLALLAANKNDFYLIVSAGEYGFDCRSY